MASATVGEAGGPLPGFRVAAAVVDDAGTLLRWSGEAAELLGHRGEDVCGTPFGALVVEDGETDAGRWADPAFWASAGTPQAGEGPSPVRARLRRAPAGSVDVTCWILPLADVRERLVLALPEEAVHSWREGASLQRALVQQDRIGVAVHDTDLRVVWTNITPELFGGPPLPPGSTLQDVAVGEDTQAAETALREVLATGRPLVGKEQRMRFPGIPGREWVLSLTVLRLEDPWGRPEGVVVMLSDTTEQYRDRRHRELLHESLARMGTSLDVTRTAQDLAKVLVPAFGDFVTVDLTRAVLVGDEPPRLGSGKTYLTRVAGESSCGGWPDGVIKPGTTFPANLPDTPALRRLQRGAVVTVDREGAIAALGDMAGMFLPEGACSVTVAPLLARGFLLGTVALWRSARQAPLDASEEVLLAEIASTGALGVDNARRYDREHRAAVALQERLLPRATIKTAAVETKGFYRPSGGRAGISGDWFDVIALPSLRVGLVIGDVTGHGLSATAMMGRMRTAIQTIADMELEPAEVLAHLESLVQRLAAETPPDQRDTVGATCLYAVYDPITRQCTMASAGQPPPVLVTDDGVARFIDIEPGPPLGVGGVPYESSTLELEPGSVLALYTDGLIRAEESDVESGLEHIRRNLAARSRPDRGLDEVGRELVAGASPAHDDIALLLARTSVVPPGSTVSWQFPADAESVGKAREMTARQLEDWGLADLVLTSELVVSELVTNAIRHAGGPVGLRLIREDVLICEVSDPSSTQPRLIRAGVTDEGGRGLFIVAQCTSRWGSRYSAQGKTIWTEQPIGDGTAQMAPVLDVS